MNFLVDGGWSSWSSYGSCSASCGAGTQTRTRTCTNPAPSNGGTQCQGDAIETRQCDEGDCPGRSLEIALVLHLAENLRFGIQFN